MRIRRESNENAEIINISSLIDVMFILIIFFLVTMTFKSLEVDQRVSLPEESVGRPLGETESVIVVNVRKSNAYMMMGKQVTVEEMSSIIKDATAKNPGRKVLIRADKEALHGYVARAVATCRHAGIAEANIGYDWKPQ
jgi:biopolymer transport protein ExbD